MLRITLDVPADPDAAIIDELRRAATELAAGKQDVVLEAEAPPHTYGMTVHVVPDPVLSPELAALVAENAQLKERLAAAERA